MKYNVKYLAKAYNEHLNASSFDVKIPKAQPFDISTYNEYKYKKMMSYFNKLYNYTDSLNQTEKFLKGE